MWWLIGLLWLAGIAFIPDQLVLVTLCFAFYLWAATRNTR